jgi:hypothetical protein
MGMTKGSSLLHKVPIALFGDVVTVLRHRANQRATVRQHRGKPTIAADVNWLMFKLSSKTAGPVVGSMDLVKQFTGAGIDVILVTDHPSNRHHSKKQPFSGLPSRNKQSLMCLSTARKS